MQDVFTFEHPNRAHKIDNTRSIRLEFECTPPGGTGAGRGTGRGAHTCCFASASCRSLNLRRGLPLAPALHRR